MKILGCVKTYIHEDGFNYLEMHPYFVKRKSKDFERISESLRLRVGWDDSMLDKAAPSKMMLGDLALVTISSAAFYPFVSDIERYSIPEDAKSMGITTFVRKFY